jgi:hypothetical protein
MVAKVATRKEPAVTSIHDLEATYLGLDMHKDSISVGTLDGAGDGLAAVSVGALSGAVRHVGGPEGREGALVLGIEVALELLRIP